MSAIVRVLLLTAVCISHGGNANAFSCYDDKGPVDWLIALKVPARTDSSKHRSEPIEEVQGTGSDYYFISSNQHTWKHSSCSVADNCGPIYSSTIQLFKESSKEEKIVLMYNDQPPDRNPAGTVYGHMKGMVGFKVKESGIWVIHSVPGFPYNSSLIYPSNGFTNGQHFMCVTFPYQELSKIAHQLAMARPYTYKRNIPSWLQSEMPQLYNVAMNKKQEFRTTEVVTTLQSQGGKTFIHLSKSKDFGKDIYASLIAPTLRSDIFVETWARGKQIKSQCDIAYEVFNVKRIKLQSATWRETNDHSKWAVTSENGEVHAVCMGDINHMKTQFKRGGGAMCFQDENAWVSLASIVADYEKCKTAAKRDIL